MPQNIEIKARVADPGKVKSIAAALAKNDGVLIEQIDTFFAVPAGRLKIRQFTDGAGELISYDRPDDAGPKASSYRKVSCEDPRALVAALSMVLPLRGEVRKRRELFLAGRTRIHLDEVEGLGSFLELEVVMRDDEPAEVGKREADGLMKALGILPSDLVTGAYIDLLERAAERQG